MQPRAFRACGFWRQLQVPVSHGAHMPPKASQSPRRGCCVLALLGGSHSILEGSSGEKDVPAGCGQLLSGGREARASPFPPPAPRGQEPRRMTGFILNLKLKVAL